MNRVLLTVLALALAAVPAASAHGDEPNRGFRSTVSEIRPVVFEIKAVMLGGDDELKLTNKTGKPLLIKGYEGEPYLLFNESGVLENRLSPAAYLNDERFGDVDLPPGVDAKKAPTWVGVSGGNTYSWHDHRAHWMSPIPPPRVRREPDQEHHIFNWRIPAELDGKPLVIAGRLEYYPPPKEGASWVLVASAVAGGLALLAGASYLLARRRGPRPEETAHS